MRFHGLAWLRNPLRDLSGGTLPGVALSTDRKAQSRAVRIADGDALSVADVDGRHAPAIDEYSVEACVDRRHPAAAVAAQEQVCARSQRARNVNVGLRVASDHDLAV